MKKHGTKTLLYFQFPKCSLLMSTFLILLDFFFVSSKIVAKTTYKYLYGKAHLSCRG